ncbi:MAG: hypothetical protein FWE03_03225 [Firmicutes bacterium]|nr:hypothetical protein [Bacillota bacterium]
MKKLIIIVAMLFSILFAAASLTACGPGQVVTIGLNDPLPWSQDTFLVHEISTFEVRRYFNTRNDENEIERELINVPSLSTVTYTLRQGYSLNFPSNLNIQLADTRPTVRRDNYTLRYTLLQMELKIAYCYDEGVTERISSYTVFDSANMAAKFSWRRAMVSALVQDGEFIYGDGSHQMWVDYRSDYRNAFLIYYPAPNQTNYNIRSVPDAPGDFAHFCNEYLFFLLRALNSTNPPANQSTSQYIDFFVPFNNLIQNNRIRPLTIRQETSGTHVAFPFSGINDIFVQDNFNIDESSLAAENFWEHPRLARRTNLRLDTNRSGPDISLYFSAYPIRPASDFNPARPRFALNNVLMQIVTNTHGMRGGSFDWHTPLYTQVFSLVEYWNGVV